jgi:hypothetical protein
MEDGVDGYTKYVGRYSTPYGVHLRLSISHAEHAYLHPERAGR